MSSAGTDRLDHSIAQMLPLITNEREDDWSDHVADGISVNYDSLSSTTGLAPMKVHLGRFPALPPTVIECRGAS